MTRVFWCDEAKWELISRWIRDRFNARLRIDEVRQIPRRLENHWAMRLTVSLHDSPELNFEEEQRQLWIEFHLERGAFIASKDQWSNRENIGPFREKQRLLERLEEWFTTTEVLLRLGACP